MAIKEKSKIIEVNTLEMPEELKELPNWVLWRAELDDKRQEYKKVPYSYTGYRASATNNTTWGSFNKVFTVLESNSNYQGVGFVLSADNDYVVLDIDNAIDEDGQINSDLAKDMMRLTYCEKSPSGTGLHCFFKGELPKERKKKRTDLDIELYDNARFMTVTGCSIGESEISGDQAILDNLFERYFKTDVPIQQEEISEETSSKRLTDERVIELMLEGKNGAKIRDLLKGEYHDHFDSHSEAVASLLYYLAYYTGKNREQMERIFTSYGLYYDKWERPQNGTTWGQIELDSALHKVTDIHPIYKDDLDEFSVIIEDANNEQIIKEFLNGLGETERKYLEQIWIEQGKKGRKPTTIPPNRCAYLLDKYLIFILFNTDENTKLAMYLPDEGIYTQNSFHIKRVLSWLEPKHNSSKADDVIYHLKNKVKVKDKTNSPNLIPVKNGVFNNKTKQLEPFTPEYVFTTKIDTAYKKQSQVPTIDGWNVEEWLNEIACGNSEIVTLLWQVINDSLNGNYTRKKAIFLVGDGNNGKGTFQELLTNVIGGRNVANLKVNEFDGRFNLSVLEGKTAVIGDDVPVGVYVDDSSNFKSVVTGDPVLVEFKNQPLYRATFKCTVIQSTNGMPSFKDKTNGTIRRLIIVPFKADFNGQTENFKIKEEYVKNQKVLEYVLYKAINLTFETFNVPEVSKQMLDVFKQHNDPVYEFKVNVFDKWNVRKVPKYIVYGFYKEFCRDNGYYPLSDRKFHKQFKSHLGVEWDTEKKGKVLWENLIDHIGDLDMMSINLEFPDKDRTYSLYENESLKVI